MYKHCIATKFLLPIVKTYSNIYIQYICIFKYPTTLETSTLETSHFIDLKYCITYCTTVNKKKACLTGKSYNVLEVFVNVALTKLHFRRISIVTLLNTVIPISV